jgi:hypothetical protein
LYGGKWRTQAIVVNSANDDATANNIQTALEELPNGAMKGVQVYPTSEAEARFGHEIKRITLDRK